MAFGIAACGSFLLFAASILLLVSCISSPVIDRISFLNINYANTRATFGVFGYCIDEPAGVCTRSTLGYETSAITALISDSNWLENHLGSITKALILHPIAAGVAFLSFLVASCSDRLGFIFSSLLAFLAFLISLGAMIVDFILFTILRNEINNRVTGARASYAVAIWLTLAATVVLFLASFVVLFGCCAGRRERRGDGRYGGKY